MAKKESGRDKLTGGTWSLERRDCARELGVEQAFTWFEWGVKLGHGARVWREGRRSGAGLPTAQGRIQAWEKEKERVGWKRRKREVFKVKSFSISSFQIQAKIQTSLNF